MILKNVRGNRVLGISPKKALSALYREIVIYPQRQVVEKDVAIWAKAKDVFRDIRAIVGTPKRFDMADLRIRTCHCYESCAADLASKIVQSLNPLTHRCARYHPRNC